ncbi:metallophosphoesterase [Achromobacter denitrificans]|jgi:serine/threonine protein phosphatase 1
MRTPLVVEHAKNSDGRDFVVPDLHGSYSLLMNRLDQLKFDPNADRIFSVGDLVDRGPEPMNTLRLLREPWFYAVRGNHDDMLLSALGKMESWAHSPNDFFYNGGTWATQLSKPEMDELLTDLGPRVEALPYIRTVLADDGSALFHVAHAELMFAPGSARDLDGGESKGLFTDADIRALAAGETPAGWGGEVQPSLPLQLDRFRATTTWGRRLIKEWHRAQGEGQHVVLPQLAPAMVGSAEAVIATDKPYERGLSLTFVGHTIVEQVGLHRSHFYMDRGAYRAARAEPDPGSQLEIVDAGILMEHLQRYLPRPPEMIADPGRPDPAAVMPLPRPPSFRFR